MFDWPLRAFDDKQVMDGSFGYYQGAAPPGPAVKPEGVQMAQ